MSLSVPMLDVFYIDFTQPVIKPKSKKSGLLKAAAYIVGGPIALLATSAGLKALGEDGPSLKRLIDEKRFSIIESQEALNAYVNANGNEWVTNSKTLKQRQYYIRHPKQAKNNILVEAKDFYSFIEEEQKDELIHFIMSHCSAKVIQIDRTEILETEGKAAAKVQGADIAAGATYGQMKGNYYNFTSPNGTPKTEPRQEYFWIDKSIMSSIKMLTEGASITQSYQSDFTFGLSIAEAKTVGLDMNMHKKFSYTIHIEC